MTTNKPTQPRLFEMPVKTQKPVECLGITFENDGARRAYFTEKLRQKLQDPEFRQIEGFPIGSDEDILTLSDPPYYTACPNPFIEDFIKFYGTPYERNEPYNRGPFASDVRAGKNDPIYRAHSYHTKVPHKAIMRYILHYTAPGDVVFDGFCGTGMSGIAAQACGNPTEKVRLEIEATMPDVKWGERYPILCDLSVLPAFIASNLNSSTSPDEVERMFNLLLQKAKQKYEKYFLTEHKDGRIGIIQYSVWSDVFICHNCYREVVFWNGAVDLDMGKQKDPFPCPHCNAELKKRTLDRAFLRKIDPITELIYQQPKQKLVLINYSFDGQRFTKKPSEKDLFLAKELEDLRPTNHVVIKELPKGDRFYKDGLHLVNLTYYHRFYFPRTLHVLSYLWSSIDRLDTSPPLKNRLKFILTSMLDRNLTIRNRFIINKHNPRGRINGPLANTLYVPGLSVEQNPLEALSYKSKEVMRAFSLNRTAHTISTQSLTGINLPPETIDYIFVDPPFGHNIMYSELNGLSESWLKVDTNNNAEAVVSKHQHKSTQEYMELMEACFATCFRALKPNRWMTVEFHNSKNSIWNAIQEAISRAGFIIADVRTLDKKKGTINQEYYSAGAVKQDLVISAYKPATEFERDFKRQAGTEEGAWDFVRSHLRQLPVFVTSKNRQVEVIAERMNYLLFDRMVAFHVQRGVSVPLSAAEFYAGLDKRFSKREGMYFLGDQMAEYEKKRISVPELLQLELIVTDESSAIRWLRQQLTRKPQRFQELQPQFMKELSAWPKHQVPLELVDLLAENFLRYEGKGPIPQQIWSWMCKSSNFRKLMEGQTAEHADASLRNKAKDRWYVPDPDKAQDLEKLRERALLKEFEEYKAHKGKRLPKFRLEAVRAGFKQAWKAREYATIIKIAEKIPEKVLQEDHKLVMWYDQAKTRRGDGF